MLWIWCFISLSRCVNPIIIVMLFILKIFLLLFFAAFAWLAYKDIKNGIYAVIFLLPTYLIRFSILGIPTTALEIMIYILFLLWFYKDKHKIKIRNWIESFYGNNKLFCLGVLLLFLGAALSTVNSVNLRTSLGILKGWFFDPFLFFIIFINEIKNYRQAINSLLSFVLSGFALSLISIAYILNGNLTFDGRLRVFYESPNYLAMYLAPGFLFAVYLFIFNKSVLKGAAKSESILHKTVSRPSFQAIVLLCFAAVLFMTKSYGAFLGIAAAGLFFIIKKHAWQKKEININARRAIVIFFAAFIFLFIFFSYQKYEQVISSNERSSFHSRLMIWNASFEMLKDSPVLGIGPGTFQEVYLAYQSRFSVPYLEWAVAEPHNTFLAFYLQSGVIGLLGFMLLLSWFCKKAKSNDIILLFLVYFLVHGLVDTLYWKNDLSVIFWMIAGTGMTRMTRDGCP